MSDPPATMEIAFPSLDYINNVRVMLHVNLKDHEEREIRSFLMFVNCRDVDLVEMVRSHIVDRWFPAHHHGYTVTSLFSTNHVSIDPDASSLKNLKWLEKGRITAGGISWTLNATMRPSPDALVNYLIQQLNLNVLSRRMPALDLRKHQYTTALKVYLDCVRNYDPMEYELFKGMFSRYEIIVIETETRTIASAYVFLRENIMFLTALYNVGVKDLFTSYGKDTMVADLLMLPWSIHDVSRMGFNGRWSPEDLDKYSQYTKRFPR
jgi:hypothetical protein